MINGVRNSVLSVLNKNNYGYISPSDFNLFAANSQMEIYEEYYSNFNKVVNAENTRSSGTGYADIKENISETLEYFLRTDYLWNISTNKYWMPSITTTGYDTYMILNVKCNTTTLKTGTNTSIVTNELVDSFALFLTYGIVAGDIITNLNTGLVSTVLLVMTNTTLLLNSDIFLASGDSYAIVSSLLISQAEKINNNKFNLLVNSNLTKPTNQFPVYALQGEELTFYPKTLMYKGQIEATYFRFPKVPKWTYISLANGEPVFDQSQTDYQDFELPLEDEYKLVTKILEYCGMSIREQEVTQFGMAEQQHEQPTFSMQQ